MLSRTYYANREGNDGVDRGDGINNVMPRAFMAKCLFAANRRKNIWLCAAADSAAYSRDTCRRLKRHDGSARGLLKQSWRGGIVHDGSHIIMFLKKLLDGISNNARSSLLNDLSPTWR